MGGNQEASRGPATVVIVDDDKAVRNALRFALEIEGFKVRTYASVPDVLADIPRNEAGCLVVDYRLAPMNGLDLLAELRLRGVQLPAILITTHPGEAVIARALRENVPLIEKPLIDGALLQAIRAIVDQPDPA